VSGLLSDESARSYVMGGIKRTTAERYVELLRARAEQANRQEFAYKVSRLEVFGSFVNSDKEMLGDLDVWITLEKIDDDKGVDRHLRLSQKRINAALQAGRQFRNMVDETSWPMNEVILFLRSGTRKISLHIPSWETEIYEDSQPVEIWPSNTLQ
jgi:predicted nucleotidyltransferase